MIFFQSNLPQRCSCGVFSITWLNINSQSVITGKSKWVKCSQWCLKNQGYVVAATLCGSYATEMINLASVCVDNKSNTCPWCWVQCYCSFPTTISTVSALDQCDHKSCCFCGSKHCLPANLEAKNCQHVTFDSPTAVVKVSGVLPGPKLRAACFHLRWQKGQISSCRQEYLWWKLDQHGPKPVREWGLCDRELQTHSILQKHRAKNILKTIHHPKDTLLYIKKTIFISTCTGISSVIFLSKLSAMWPNSWGLSPAPAGSFLGQCSLSLYAFGWQDGGLQSFYSLWCSGPSHSLLLRSL